MCILLPLGVTVDQAEIDENILTKSELFPVLSSSHEVRVDQPFAFIEADV